MDLEHIKKLRMMKPKAIKQSRSIIKILILIIISSIACVRKDGNSESISIIKCDTVIDNTTFKLSFQGYNSDSGFIKHGYFKISYPSGQLKSILNYTHNTISGLELGYFDNGSLEYKGAYKEGLREGEWTYYYNSGNIMAIENLYNGKPFGNTTWFRPDKILEKHLFYSFEGVLYIKKYSSEGGCVSEQGAPYYCAYNTDSLLIGQAFYAMIFIANPPNTSVTLDAYFKQSNNLFKIVKSSIDVQTKINTKTYVFTDTSQEVINKEWIGILSIVDTVCKTSRIDTISLLYSFYPQ
jgi:hypothetical protein